MPFVIQVSLSIDKDQASDLTIGAALERVIGYMRARLPNEPGFVTSRAMRSIAEPGAILVVIESVWEEWDDLVSHQASGHTVTAVLSEFGGIMATDAPSIRRFEDVA
jgi:hypothetical protein